MRTDFRYRSFDVNEIFQQRLNFEKHKRKLQQLSSGNKLNIFPSRTQQIERYRSSKHNSFLKQLRQRTTSINKSNIRIFERLAGAQDFIHHGAQTPVESNSTHLQAKEPITHKRKSDWQREHENARMQIRLKSLVSSINTRKINDEYRRSLQIRNRITRYQTNPLTHRIAPKAQKFINHNTMSGTVRSADSRHSSTESKSKLLTVNKNPRILQDKEKEKRIELVRTSLAHKRRLRQGNISSFARYQDINNETPADSKQYIKQTHTHRQEHDQHKSNTLFPTQVEPDDRILNY